MKWIKASERLPELEKAVHVKIEGDNAFGEFYELVGKKRFGVNDRHKLDSHFVAEEHFHLIEWLDESPSAPVEQEGQEEMWEDVIGTFQIDVTNKTINHFKSKYIIIKR